MKIKKSVPKGWSEIKVGTCLVVKHGRNQKFIEVPDGEYPILATGGQIGRTNTPAYSKPSVLIGRKGTIDKPQYIDKPFWTVDTLFYTEIKDGFSAKYLYFYFLTINWKLYNEGSGIPSLSASTISNIKITIPNFPEQNRIVSVLETWDKAIETLKQKIEIKKEIKKGLMQNLLTGKIRLLNFKQNWKDKKFGELFDQRDERGAFGLPLLSITGDKGVIYQSDSNKKDNSNLDKSKYLRIYPGDIGYNTMRMWQGRSALSSLEGLVSPAYTILKPKKDVDSRYFAYLFKLPRVINFFFQKSQGLVSDTLQCRYKDFSIIRYKLPDYEEQTLIADILTTADKDIENLEKKLTIVKDQKTYLLNNLITGTIRTPENLSITN